MEDASDICLCNHFTIDDALNIMKKSWDYNTFDEFVAEPNLITNVLTAIFGSVSDKQVKIDNLALLRAAWDRLDN
jgi:hypothetical protein